MGSRSLLLSKFRGSLLGALLGDCLASPFEMDTACTFAKVNLYFAQLFDPNKKIPYKPYTDDTVMTRAVTETLIEHKGLNPQQLAKRFMTDYFAEPKRGYGGSVHDVFMNFRRNGFEDPFYAARKQFSGQGSFGNGAAMRVAPVGLFCHHDLDQLVSMSSAVSRITHAHAHAVQGAILQALAVREAFLLDSTKELDSLGFVDTLLFHMQSVEKDVRQEDSLESVNDEGDKSYTKKLQKIKEYLGRTTMPSAEEVDNELGVGVAALHSVPTAIYAFLIGNRPIPGIETENQLVRSIAYAISLGGDTDTIASMAGAISGAYLGYDGIPKELLRHCEKSEMILQFADELCTTFQNQIPEAKSMGS